MAARAATQGRFQMKGDSPMAIATGNIKVNGRWYKAGEEYEPENRQVRMPVIEEPESVKTEDLQAEPKITRQKTSTRRKTK